MNVPHAEMRGSINQPHTYVKVLGACSTVVSPLSEHAGIKGCSDNGNVRISKAILFLYKAEYLHLIII